MTIRPWWWWWWWCFRCTASCLPCQKTQKRQWSIVYFVAQPRIQPKVTQMDTLRLTAPLQHASTATLLPRPSLYLLLGSLSAHPVSPGWCGRPCLDSVDGQTFNVNWFPLARRWRTANKLKEHARKNHIYSKFFLFKINEKLLAFHIARWRIRIVY